MNEWNNENVMNFTNLAEPPDVLELEQMFYNNFERNECSENFKENNQNINSNGTEVPLIINTDKNGNPQRTIENFLLILKSDEEFSGLKFNQLTASLEVHKDGKIQPWSDSHEAGMRNYIEGKFGLYDPKKLDDALKILSEIRGYHPIKNLIESVKWDGVERVQTMLSRWMNCEENPYSREVSRLIFAGGIHRLYNPACKFDEVPILIGTKQGEGKSTFVRWLALEDAYFREVCEMEGQRGIEALRGGWICELSELLALTKAKEVEGVKSYLTRLEDVYRQPYDKHVTRLKRQCIFIGTTNHQQFLTDKTGNRRFYPVVVKQKANKLFESEEQIKWEILQCWAEAKEKLNTEEMRPFASLSLQEEIKSEQMSAQEEDCRAGLIEEFIQGKSDVCVLELWREALGNAVSTPTVRESREISLILRSLGWEYSGSSMRYGCGTHRRWNRVRS